MKPNHLNLYALKIYEYIKQMVASAKFGSRWEGQNRVIQFLNFPTFDLRLRLKKYLRMRKRIRLLSLDISFQYFLTTLMTLLFNSAQMLNMN